MTAPRRQSLWLCGPDSEPGAAFARLATATGYLVLPQLARPRGDLREPGEEGVALVVAAATLEDATARLVVAKAQLELPILLFAPAHVLDGALEAGLPFDDVLERGADGAALARRLRFLGRLRDARVSCLAAQRLAEVGAITASVGHELTNPLSFVRANLQVLATAMAEVGRRSAVFDDPSELPDLLAETREGVERVIAIVQDLRSCVRRGGAPTLTDLAACASSALTLLRGDLGACSTVERLLEAVPPVLADPGRMVQVILNLLSNARDAVSRQGRIEVRTCQDADGLVVVEVRDDGAGMDPATLARAFDPFFTTKPASKGTGLGLAISRRIVEGYGGTIQAESAPGRGSRFRVQLPPAAA